MKFNGFFFSYPIWKVKRWRSLFFHTHWSRWKYYRISKNHFDKPNISWNYLWQHRNCSRPKQRISYHIPQWFHQLYWHTKAWRYFFARLSHLSKLNNEVVLQNIKVLSLSHLLFVCCTIVCLKFWHFSQSKQSTAV